MRPKVRRSVRLLVAALFALLGACFLGFFHCLRLVLRRGIASRGVLTFGKVLGIGLVISVLIVELHRHDPSALESNG